MAPFSKILSSRPSWLRVSIRGRPGENPPWRESAPRRRHSFRQRITELAAQWTRRATSFKDRSSSNSFSARLRRSESSSAEPFGRIWTSCTLEVYYCIILCEVNRGGKRSKGELARTLTEFVRANVHRANPFVGLYRPETPDGFDSIVISAESRVWWCGEGGGYTLDDIRPQLAARISSKDKLVPTYRANLPAGARVWLLLYSGVTVARSMMIPHGIEEWKFSFRFDRVFWFGEITRWEDRNLPQAAPRF